MDHIDAKAALENRFLMKWIEKRKGMLDSNMSSAPNEDHLTRLVATRQKAILDSLIDGLEAALSLIHI